MYITQFLCLFILWWTLCLLTGLAVVNNASWACGRLFQCVLLFSLGNYPEVELLDHTYVRNLTDELNELFYSTFLYFPTGFHVLSHLFFMVLFSYKCIL